jgi:sulfhydrogenase subunit beta (sulfur reductase)
MVHHDDPSWSAPATPLGVGPEHVQCLFEALQRRGYRLIGPTRRDGAVVYAEIGSVEELPAGWTSRQAPGAYRLAATDARALFADACAATPWKSHLHPSSVRLWRARREDGRIRFTPEAEPLPPLALIGVRPCDLAALDRLDGALVNQPWRDPIYEERRRTAFVVALNCTTPGGTCFCASLHTGPAASSGYDIVLTEAVSEAGAVMIAERGSARGAEVLAELGAPDATGDQVARARGAVAAAASRMGRALDTGALPELLLEHFEHPRWDDVAKRCLTCGNCTFSCPTCFCTTVDEAVDMSGEVAERWRRWDTCFSVDFSYMYGGSVRLSPRSRYRQWLTHKLATWQDQFGTSGCVGCGRCITWCPVGIDITVEARALREAVSPSPIRSSSSLEPEHEDPRTTPV